MNTKIILSIAVIAGVLFSACKKDESPAAPTITINELGHGDSHSNDNKATIGASLHFIADIVADGKIDYITIEMHTEEEEEHEGHDHGHEWELDTTFSGTGITGLKNLSLHKDLKIDASAEPGVYHFHITIVDMEGNSGSAEAEVTLIEQPQNIMVENLSINAGKHDLSKADSIFIISFDASVTEGTLVSYSLEAHNHPASGLVADEEKLVDETFTADFAGKATANVEHTVVIDPAKPNGDYHVEIIITDSNGNELVKEGHIDLVD